MVAHRRSQLPAAMAAARPMPVILIGALACALLGLSACHVAPRAVGAAAPAARGTPAASERQYRIDGTQSEVLILVYRDGRLAALGHNHVIAVRQLSGSVWPGRQLTDSRWRLEFPVSALSVDDPDLRTAQGADFQTHVDAVAIAGTREHMLGAALLDAEHYPVIVLQSTAVRSDADGVHLGLRIVVREHSADIEVPALLQQSDAQISASGEFDLTHAQLGLTPYSVGLGALRVAERMHVRFRLLARP